MRALALLATAALLAAAPAAHAGPDDWRGPYAGFGIGAANARSTWNTDATLGTLDESIEHTANAGMGGLQFGYRGAPAGPLRLGVEFAWYAARIEKSSPSTLAGAANSERITRVKNPLSLALQAGLAGSNVLAYARGGFTFARVELQAINHTTSNVAVWDDNAYGWTAGGGLEVKVHRAWSVGLQYDYSKLRMDNATTVSNSTLVQATDFHTRLHTVLLRLNYNY